MDQSGDPRAVPDIGARLRGRAGDERVEHGASGRVQGVDAVRGFDRQVDLLIGIREPGVPHRRCPGSDHAVEQVPAGKLHHAATHQGVGGQRVGSGCTLFDDDHIEAVASQQHRRRRARRTGADDGDVVDSGTGHPASTSIDTGTPLVSTS